MYSRGIYNKRKLSLILLILLFLVGCVAMVPKIDVDPKFWADKEQVIGVAIAKLPTPASLKSGNQGLLDVLINEANASDLDKHLASLDISSVNQLNEKVVTYLTSKNIKAVKIDSAIDIKALPELNEEQRANKPHIALHDYTSLKEQYHVDKLLVITVVNVGTMRSYYGFIPTSAPVGSCSINGKIINLSNNELEWNQTTTQNVPSADANWDTPPEFPGLTKAVFSAYEQTQQMLINQFMQ